MPSRINLGPEGGPYVGIDEDNGDYILEDNAGNPIMRWDESAGQWDFEEHSLSNIQSVSTEKLNSDYVYAGAFDGADADARLDEAITAAGAGDVIRLEKAIYESDRTIETFYKIEGVGVDASSGGGSAVEGNWTFNEYTQLESIRMDDSIDSTEFVFNSSFCRISDSILRDITVQDDSALITSCISGDVTFDTGTANGLVDGCTGVNVTDNGSNNVGDIA